MCVLVKPQTHMETETHLSTYMSRRAERGSLRHKQSEVCELCSLRENPPTASSARTKSVQRNQATHLHNILKVIVHPKMNSHSSSTHQCANGEVVGEVV